MKEKQKHIKRNWNPRKLCMAGTALLVMLVITVYGVASRAFAYETVTWNGDFTPARREWSYSTNSYADVSTTGFSERVWMANQGLHGFGRSVGNETTTAVMEESKMASYIRSKSSKVKPGDTVTWSADVETTFRYKLNGSVVVSSVHGTAAKANKEDNTDRTSEKNGMISATSKFEFPDWSSNNKGALVFALTDSSGIPRGFCHQFGDSGYRQNLVKSGSFQMEAPMLKVSADPEIGGSVSQSGTTKTTIGDNTGDFAFEGTKVTVSATVNDGYVFEGWYDGSGKQVSTSTSYPFYMPSSDYELTAKFTKNNPEKYTLSVSADPEAGGTVEGDSGMIYEGTEVTVEAGAKSGWSFVGWQEGNAVKSTEETYTFTMPGRNVTLVAKFAEGIVTPPPVTPTPTPIDPPEEEETTYTVTLVAVGNGTVSGGGTYKEGDTVSINAIPDTPGNKLGNWYSSDCSISNRWSESTSFTMPGHDVMAYAYFDELGPNVIWYYPNGGKGSKFFEETDSYSDYTHYAAEVPADWTPPAGYSAFTEWNTRKDGTGTSYKENGYISYTGSELYLYARWKPITYNVIFAAHDIQTENNTFGEVQKWTYDSPSPMPEKPYDKIYTVKYDYSKKSGMSTTPQLTAALTDKNTKALFEFIGWHPYHYLLDKTYESIMPAVAVGKKVNLSSTQDDVVYVFPQWGGDSSYVTLPDITCTGYDFLGWAEEAGVTDITKMIIGTYQPRVNNKTLYAGLVPKTYPVALDYQIPDINYKETVIMTFDAYGPDVAVPVREHYTFQGYFTKTDGQGTKYYDSQGKSTRTWTIADGSVKTLYAYWVKDTQIIYDRNGGLGYMQDTWLDGNATKGTLAKNTFSKRGHSFSGWNTKADGTGTSYTDGQTITGIPVSSVITLYARWTPEGYTVTFDPNGGTVSPTSKGVTYGKAYGELPVPEYAGYSFVGWYMEDTGELVTADSTVTKLTDHTLVAKWQEKAYTVTFDWNFDYEREGIDKQTKWNGDTMQVIYNSTYGNLPEPEKEGYTFMGWYTEEITAGTFVKRLYREVMGREADAGGLSSWVAALESDSQTAAQVAGAFITSQEFLNRNVSNTEFVKILYRVLLNREADAGGLSSWAAALDGGTDRMAVFNALTTSGEYTALCPAYESSDGNGSGAEITSGTPVSTPGDHVLHAKWQNNEYTLKFDYNYEYRVNPDN